MPSISPFESPDIGSTGIAATFPVNDTYGTAHLGSDVDARVATNWIIWVFDVDGSGLVVDGLLTSSPVVDVTSSTLCTSQRSMPKSFAEC